MLIVRYILLQPEVEGDISFATNRGHFISLLQIVNSHLKTLFIKGTIAYTQINRQNDNKEALMKRVVAMEKSMRA